MSPQTIASIFIIVIMLAIAAYDLYALIAWGEGATISLVLRSLNQWWSFFAYLVSFAMGCLFGHFFLSSTIEVEKKKEDKP